MNSVISENEILYTAKNHKYPIFILILLFAISVAAALLMTIFLFHMDYKIGFLISLILFTLGCYRNFLFCIKFFNDKLFITAGGILIKQNKNYKEIKWADIQFIKQETRAESSELKSYTIIKLKNEKEIVCMNISDFKKFVEVIKETYPAFDCEDCLKEDIGEEIKTLKSALSALAVLLVYFSIKQFGFYFFMNKFFWMICAPIIILVTIAIIPTLKKLNKKNIDNNTPQ